MAKDGWENIPAERLEYCHDKVQDGYGGRAETQQRIKARILNPTVGSLAFIFWDKDVGGSLKASRSKSDMVRLVFQKIRVINNVISGLEVRLVGGRQVRQLLQKPRERINGPPKMVG